MALVTIRNTFLHATLDEDNSDTKPHVRSTSAPPLCRKAEGKEGDWDSSAHSTTCESLELDALSVANTYDGDEIASTVANTEYGDDSPPMSSYESEHGDNNATMCQSSAPQLSPEAAQQQLDEMSEMVMNIWSKLRSIEAQCDNSVAASLPQPALMGYAQGSVTSVQQPQQLDSKAPLFVPSCSSCKLGESQTLINSAAQRLRLLPGVAGVEVNLGPACTLATISIQLHSTTAKSLAENAIIAAKTAFLEMAANSQTSYVLGYEAEAFQDITSEMGFAFTLASMPTTWGQHACWDVYQNGVCRRRKTCKWKHPGKNELQPVRVVVC